MPSSTSRVPSARDRAHAAMVDDIVGAARRQLAEVGAARLSLRAVTRELGVVSSAIYRYFPSKDDLLTELIVRSYDELGEAAESAEAAVPRGDLPARMHALFDAVRGWALAHPHEWGLLYGTPVPGYRAPELTKRPASRVAAALAAIASDGLAVGSAAPGPLTGIEAGAIASAQSFAQASAGAEPTELVAVGLISWTWLQGVISAELWGHLEGSVDDPAEFFRAATDYFAASLGLAGPEIRMS